MKKIKFKTIGEFVLSIIDEPWSDDDPRGPGGQFIFNCNTSTAGTMYSCRHFTYSGDPEDEHAVMKLTQAENVYNETLRMIESNIL